MSYYRTTTSNGHKYKQLVESRWNPDKKRSEVHVIKHLGSVIEKDGKEILKPSPLKIDSIDKVYPVGKLAVYWKLAEEFKVRECLAKALEDEGTADAILLMAYNQLIGRKPLTKIGKWVSETPISRWMDIPGKDLTKDHFLNALDSISNRNDDVINSYTYTIQNRLSNAWKEVIGNEPERYFFFHDITRIKWNGAANYWAGKGYGAQPGRHYLGFGLVVSKENFMPIMGYPVRGIKHDSTTAIEAIDNLSRWKHKNLTIVWDRGFVSQDNVHYARDANFHVLSGIPNTTNDSEYWMTRFQDSEIEQRENVLSLGKDHVVYYKDEIHELYGTQCRIVVMLDPDRRNHSRINRDICLQNLELEMNKRKIAQLKKGLEPLVKASKGRRGYFIDDAVEKQARNSDGRSLFFCTDPKLSGENIIKTYFQKDYVEKAFRYLKGNACLSPVRYQLPGRVEAYLSVINFIAYELIAGILWKIKTYDLGVSYEELMDEAEKIYEVELTSSGKKTYRWTHIAKETEKLFKPYGIIDLQPTYQNKR